jgi:putative ABC transport system ATP-binding protein
MHPILKAEDLKFQKISYPFLEIPKNRTTFISGDSGSGKSSLLAMFNGVLSPASGFVYYDGDDILTLNSLDLRRDVLLVSQSLFLFDKSIRENFAAFYAARQMPTPTDDEMTRYLSLCCLHVSPNTMCTTLSGGERQRVYIAIYLSFMPKVLMLDEPTSALDDHTADLLIQNLKSFCQEVMTLVIVSHDRSLIEKFADHTIVLGSGMDAQNILGGGL